MADITTSIKESPASICFAGNPIVYKVETSKGLGSDESFLRILCNATFALNGSVDWYDGNMDFHVELSQPVANHGTATFNLSDAAQTLIRSIQSSIDMNGDAPLPAYGLVADVEFKTVFVYDNQEVSTGEVRASRIFIIPGALTDFELVTTGGNSLADTLSQGRFMTRKPDGGVLHKGELLILPTVRYTKDVDLNPTSTANGMLVTGESYNQSASVIEHNELDYQTIYPSSTAHDGDYMFTSDYGGSLSGYYRTNTNGVYFIRFINGFGAVENISVRVKDKLSYEVSGETHSLVQDISVRPSDRRYATKAQPVGVYELSSGYVPKRWAEWYVQELLTSPRVWIQLGGKWIPALIEAEDDCVIYDRVKPEMPHVDFTLRLAIDGVTGITW